MVVIRGAALCLFLLCLTDCATYGTKVRAARELFGSGQYEAAALELTNLAEKKDNDLLLYLMELGMVRHAAGNYRQAIEHFREAEKIAVLNDYTSVSQEISSVLLNDSTKVYKGEDFEKILINVYLAIDYTLMGNFEDALVECRRVNQKLDIMIAEGNLPYAHNSFAKYLAASLFESQREYNDAFVDYRTVKKWLPSFSNLPGPLMRVADKLQSLEELAEFQKSFPEVINYRISKNEGEVILIFEQGRAPYKIPNPAFELVPIFARKFSNFKSATLRDQKGLASNRADLLFDIEGTAIYELQQKIVRLTAKKIGGMVAKRAMAYGVGQATKSREAEFLSYLLLSATDHADLRSWVTLPATLRLARITLPAGRHDLLLDRVAGDDRRVVKKWEGVQVKAGQITFLNLRVFD